ncbi:MAG TPA: PorV/PorQ family protein [Rhodothermales bacterium]|nr:hypothetical protein [Bacteroidota bacterium]HRK73286.1 PorV/PorQ family protein [Rhodothermales bacterium]HRR07472.1 PorV/PorQ family protein [Rhodothermales bacterium]
MCIQRFFSFLFFISTLSSLPLGVAAQSTGAFSRMGSDARGVAMGNALVAEGFGQTSGFYNPALAPYIAEQHLMVSYSALTFDRNLQSISFASPMKPQAGITAGLIHGGVSKIDGRDASGYHTEDIGTNEYLVYGAFGTRIGRRTTFGIRFSYFLADYYENVEPSTTLSLSSGITVKIRENLRLGFTTDDLLGKYRWDTSKLYEENGRETTDNLPVRLRTGAAWQSHNQKLTLSGEVESRVEKISQETPSSSVQAGILQTISGAETLRLQSTRLRLGAEYWLSSPIALRAGLEQTEAAFLPSAGFSIRQNLGELRFKLDYALRVEPFGTGLMHLLSLRMGL